MSPSDRSTVAGQLLAHRVQRRLCAPAAGVAAGALAALPVLAELRPRSAADAVQLAALLLALATATAATDPIGALADASPTPAGRRLALRAVPVLATVAIGWVVALAAVPAGVRPTVPSASWGLAALCALVVAGGVVEARLRPRAAEPLTAAAGVAMAWAALWVLRPTWSPFGGGEAGAAVALVGSAAVLAVAGGDRWRRVRRR